MNQQYVDTVRLLLTIAPAVFESQLFAMKGGTALNLFVQDLPRLSVDIDVVVARHDLPRDEALAVIARELAAAKVRIEKLGFATTLHQDKDGTEAKMFVTDQVCEVKVEVNFVFRGTVLPVVRASLVSAAQDLLSTSVEIPMLAVPELYGSKLVAALDRQHPRNLFDVMWMYERFGLPASFVDCFVAYLAGHNRPIHEVLFAKPQPLASVYEAEFRGMTSADVSLQQLESTRSRLFDEIPRALTTDHQAFLLSLVEGAPDWSRMPFAHLQELPAIRWKLLNLEKLKKRSANRYAEQHAHLKAGFAALAGQKR